MFEVGVEAPEEAREQTWEEGEKAELMQTLGRVRNQCRVIGRRDLEQGSI